MNHLRTSLFWKLMLTFVIVVLVAVGAVAIIARQTTTSEFHRLRQGENQARDGEQVTRLADYYAANGSWDGVATLSRSGSGQGQGSGPPVRLADVGGRLVLDMVENQVGQQLSADELAQGEPVVVDGQRVGTLFVGGYAAAALSQSEQAFLDRVGRALLIGALVAIAVALTLGFTLFREITAPLRHLTRATAQVAGGDLAARVAAPAQGGDEIARLGQSFNQMMTELARADRVRRDMIADIAHELRTPLTVIQGNLEAILDGVYPPDAEHLHPVLRKTQLLNRLVEDLRTLALADAGELTLHRAPMELGGLVQRTVQGFQARAREAGVALTAHAPPLPRVRADAARLEQVLGILLDNALRHTPAGGRIQVEATGHKGEIWLSVQDTGAGISPEALPHVFERFYRVKNETARPGGSGLGLAIAQTIVTAHGGRIWAESEPGHGTTMVIALPQEF